MRTKGEWIRKSNYIATPNWETVFVVSSAVEYNLDDLDFVAMCGTIAHQLDSRGIDGEKAIELLPEIVSGLEQIQTCQWCLLTTCRGCLVPKAENILSQLQLKPERKEGK